jgi:fructan beta-fructosidase
MEPFSAPPVPVFVSPARPAYHFTPPSGWMNDPNGLVWFDGEYHLFYQHLFPSHWGHAVGVDLLHWEHMPIALAPDERGLIASGSAVVDEHDTSGFFGGRPGLVAIFTHWGEQTQDQSIAYSTDNGRSWTKYAGNPVVPNPGIRDFRDPKVIWHAPTQRWVMTVAVYDRVHFYVSPNLREWTFASEFGAREGSHDGVWECPDLVDLPVEGNPGARKWTLHVSVNAREGRIMQYFVGEFDGARFANDNNSDTTLWADHGADFYAAVTWSSLPPGDDRRVWIGWMNNWTYAKTIETQPWQGMMSVPRTLSLRATDDGLRLVQRPVAELASLRSEAQAWLGQPLRPGDDLLCGVRGRALEIVAEIELGAATAVGVRLGAGGDQATEVRYDREEATLTLDRRRAGASNFGAPFAQAHAAPMHLRADGTIDLRLYFDECSVEVFANDGEVVLSDLIFPDPSSEGLALFAEGGEAFVRLLEIHRLDLGGQNAPSSVS